jgi:archaellum component FlaF (FlaF/FlaG flagellin family)
MIFGATAAYYEDLREAQSASAQNMEEMINTAVQVEMAGYNASTKVLRVNVTNTGSVTLETALLDVVVDGILKTANITKIENGGYDGGLWYPATTISISLSGIDSPQRVKISTSIGASSYTSDIIISS